MAFTYIELTLEQNIAQLTLNRPDKRNALHGPMVNELLQALATVQEDTEVRVLILSGKGTHFCAGGDIEWMQTVATKSVADNLADAEQLAELMYRIYNMPKPVLALAQGATLGGGMGLLAAADMVIAASDASFGFSEVKIGIAPSTISPYVVAAIGARAAGYYFLTGERFDADMAQRLGLVHQIVDSQALQQSGRVLAQRLLHNGPEALLAVKSLLHHVTSEKISPELSKWTAEHLATLRTSREAREGLQAFLEKRNPDWSPC